MRALHGSGQECCLAHALPLELPADVRGDSVITLIAGPGLHGDAGPLPGVGKLELRARLDEPARLREASCAAPVDRARAMPVRGVVRLDCVPHEPLWLQFSGAVDEAALMAWAEAIDGDFRFERRYGYVGSAETADGQPLHQRPGVSVELKPRRANAALALAREPLMSDTTTS